MATTSRLILRKNEAPRQARRLLAPPTPIVKWAGGKTRLLDDLLSRRPLEFRRYYEPFLGGGAMFFRLAPPHAVLADLNPDLMNMYRCVAWNVEAVIQRLVHHSERHNHDYYYAIRERFNDRKHCKLAIERAAAFIYLNRTCFNGLYRVNQRGNFNVPIGRYESPKICNAKALRNASVVLQRTELRVGNFVDQVADAGPGDFVYFDPPYDPLNKTSNFTSYTKQDFGDQEQHDLACVVGDLTDRGVFVMVSNNDTPFIRQLYRGFKMERVAAPRAINSRATGRGSVMELVITNGYHL